MINRYRMHPPSNKIKVIHVITLFYKRALNRNSERNHPPKVPPISMAGGLLAERASEIKTDKKSLRSKIPRSLLRGASKT
jgi:hypothetical protein